METRMEKYRKFRDEIRHMADECFPQAEENPQLKELGTKAPGAFVQQAIASKMSDKTSPYRLYAKRIRRRNLILFGFFVVALVGFIVWFLLLQGRKI
ncbi:MAG TPA: hypothetical protein DEA63_00230 [Firmicutes bacterium]|nr:hypothetical protein [Bacillota bacterium]